MSQPDEHDDLAGLDVFTRGRIAKLERHAELARALTAPPNKPDTAEDGLDALVDRLALRVIQRLREMGDDQWT
jgi:hypothetical protein